MIKWEYKEPKKGDILRVKISGKLYHYGIYLGEDQVIQYGLAKEVFTAKKEDVKIVISSLDDFCNSKNFEVRKYSLFDKLKKNSPNKTITLATSRLDEHKYDLLNNNCEHFVNECVFNKHYSSQSEKYNSGN